MDMSTFKQEARKAAFLRRKYAKAEMHDAQAVAHLLQAVLPFKGRTLAGYMPIRTEVDPVPVMAAMASFSPLCVPVIDTAGAPLRFRQWMPGCRMVDGPFGARVPEAGTWLTPSVLIVPLVAFDRKGGRLGYGGGYYDRTITQLREAYKITAIGYAFSGQEAQDLPLEPTDAKLDAIVTEQGILQF